MIKLESYRACCLCAIRHCGEDAANQGVPADRLPALRATCSRPLNFDVNLNGSNGKPTRHTLIRTNWLVLRPYADPQPRR